LNDQYLVASVAEITPAGYQPLEEVRSQIEARVKRDKKVAYQVNRLQEAGGDLDNVAASLGITVQKAENIVVSNPVVPGLGRDAAFVGTLLGLAPGEQSGPVEGQTSAFIVEALPSDQIAAITDTEREAIRGRLQQQRQQAVKTQWIAVLRDAADVTDNRRLFRQ